MSDDDSAFTIRGYRITEVNPRTERITLHNGNSGLFLLPAEVRVQIWELLEIDSEHTGRQNTRTIVGQDLTRLSLVCRALFIDFRIHRIPRTFQDVRVPLHRLLVPGDALNTLANNLRRFQTPPAYFEAITHMSLRLTPDPEYSVRQSRHHLHARHFGENVSAMVRLLVNTLPNLRDLVVLPYCLPFNRNLHVEQQDHYMPTTAILGRVLQDLRRLVMGGRHIMVRNMQVRVYHPTGNNRPRPAGALRFRPEEHIIGATTWNHPELLTITIMVDADQITDPALSVWGETILRYTR
ncbi:hypothetical protein BT63DRAFT_460600 [Microthyrium microscopicum]|uniref:Uncharacterized protein n=1 Tax=Microthyrium microscopicum TaxID=703497 RepID=A0A6A6TW19_9PEZI|nr:hypothetical protein BT63DRAFT_460600 [Microthyrium microscopicum]